MSKKIICDICDKQITYTDSLPLFWGLRTRTVFGWLGNKESHMCDDCMRKFREFANTDAVK